MDFCQSDRWIVNWFNLNTTCMDILLWGHRSVPYLPLFPEINFGLCIFICSWTLQFLAVISVQCNCFWFRSCGMWHCVVGCFLTFWRNVMPAKCRETPADPASHLRRADSSRMYVFASQLHRFMYSSLMNVAMIKSLLQIYQCGHIQNLRGNMGILLHGL